jgi:hypothetical protein
MLNSSEARRVVEGTMSISCHVHCHGTFIMLLGRFLCNFIYIYIYDVVACFLRFVSAQRLETQNYVSPTHKCQRNKGTGKNKTSKYQDVPEDFI